MWKQVKWTVGKPAHKRKTQGKGGGEYMCVCVDRATKTTIILQNKAILLKKLYLTVVLRSGAKEGLEALKIINISFPTWPFLVPNITLR